MTLINLGEVIYIVERAREKAAADTVFSASRSIAQ
jgi:hypothetical protein